MTFEPSDIFFTARLGRGSRLSFSSGALSVVSALRWPAQAALPSWASRFILRLLSVCNRQHLRRRRQQIALWLCDRSVHRGADGDRRVALPTGSNGCYYDYDVAAEASGNFVYTVDANDGVAAYVNAQTGALTLASSSFTGPAAYTWITVPNAISSTATLTGLQIVPATAQIATYAGQAVPVHSEGTFSDGSTGFLTGSAT
jgi:hypothetical protein